MEYIPLKKIYYKQSAEYENVYRFMHKIYLFWCVWRCFIIYLPIYIPFMMAMGVMLSSITLEDILIYPYRFRYIE